MQPSVLLLHAPRHELHRRRWRPAAMDGLQVDKHVVHGQRRPCDDQGGELSAQVGRQISSLRHLRALYRGENTDGRAFNRSSSRVAQADPLCCACWYSASELGSQGSSTLTLVRCIEKSCCPATTPLANRRHRRTSAMGLFTGCALKWTLILICYVPYSALHAVRKVEEGRQAVGRDGFWKHSLIGRAVGLQGMAYSRSIFTFYCRPDIAFSDAFPQGIGSANVEYDVLLGKICQKF